ncbi:Immunoglobulin-binding protein 1 [Folsomia candida]|uniref:Immunoglobulin-binding protein 1 n=1 Tax=Folsomia candida TaxID=158441 RepID=A0A226F1Z9_FOLCA|nr:Immunoglobulin-binding protein 1 [Folsomia candida]
MANTEEQSGIKTLSQLFDEVYADFKKLEFILTCIKTLEHITLQVSSLDMFSRNENFNEIDPRKLKFLLLPYMLASLWQFKVGRDDRKNICQVSSVYFKDFLQRCIQYEIITSSDHLIRDDDNQDEENDVQKTTQKLTPEERRALKIRKFKQNKELGEALENYSYFSEDDGFSQEIYLALIKRAILDSEDQLEAIRAELDLIKCHDENPDNFVSSSTSSPPSKPLQPFIITKDAAQKTVYGMGYPSLPIMTVEELYEQRRQEGQWGPPPTPQTARNPEEDAELERRMKDLMEERDDPEELERKRNFDEYKDEHRRGWGNRFNRS